jgi:hypothetical protein
MNRKRGLFFVKAGFALPCVLGMLVFPALLAAQTVPAENYGRLDYQGKAIVAVLPLAGEEKEMIRRFDQGILEAVAALGKYSPREVPAGVIAEIPTDMPPIQSIVSGARYALTGGVYPGASAGEYYLQLWLWDMAGSTMIYTDDLVYDDIDGAMESVPGLVEWLFSHIREVTIETPKEAVRQDPLIMVGVRAGLSPRWYVSPGEISPGASALNLEGGVSGALRLSSLFSLQLELLLTGDTLVYRGRGPGGEFPEIEKFSSLSLMIPLIGKANLTIGPVRLSPLFGFYVTAPLGQTGYQYHYDTGGGDKSYSWSFSVPLGITAGLEGAVQYGPGKIFAGLRYAGDFGDVTINDASAFRKHYNAGNGKTSYRRSTFSVYLGYEFGFLEGKTLGGSP